MHDFIRKHKNLLAILFLLFVAVTLAICTFIAKQPVNGSMQYSKACSVCADCSQCNEFYVVKRNVFIGWILCQVLVAFDIFINKGKLLFMSLGILDKINLFFVSKFKLSSIDDIDDEL